MESDIVRVFFLSITEMSEITRFKIRSSGARYLNSLPDGQLLDSSKLKVFADEK